MHLVDSLVGESTVLVQRAKGLSESLKGVGGVDIEGSEPLVRVFRSQCGPESCSLNSVGSVGIVMLRLLLDGLRN